MNIVALLNSLDDLLYELVTWLVFYPVTLWRMLRHPLATMRYAEEQLQLPPEQQYRSAVSPPIMLILTIVLSQAVGLAIVGTSPIVKSQHGLAALVNDNTTLLLFKVFLFSIFALIMASMKVKRSEVVFDRESLKPPFYAQCYLTSPFALFAGLSSLFAENKTAWIEIVGLVLLLAAPLFYGVVQVRWFQHELGQSVWRSIVDASVAMVVSLSLFVSIILVFNA